METSSCSQHPGKPVRWTCASCGVDLCPDCGGVAYQGKTYCRGCAANVPVAPTAPKPGETPKANRDLWIGIVLSFVIQWGAGFLMPYLFPGLRGIAGWGVLSWGVVGLLPLLAAWLIARARGRHALAKGLLIGFVIQCGLGILLLAACFGLALMLGMKWQ